MKKNYFYIYTAASLSVIVPVPPRFAYGIITLLLLNFLIYAGALLKFAVKKAHIEHMLSVVVLFSLVVLTVLFKQLLFLYSPLCAFVMGTSLFLVCFSSYALGNILDTVGLTQSQHIFRTIRRTGLFTVFSLLFFLLRDIVAFGTITFPVQDGLKIIRLFTPSEQYPGHFLATIPGTLLFLGIFCGVFSLFNRKCMIILRSEK